MKSTYAMGVDDAKPKPSFGERVKEAIDENPVKTGIGAVMAGSLGALVLGIWIGGKKAAKRFRRSQFRRRR